MTPASIIAQLDRFGISLYLDAEGVLKYRAKPGAMTDEARATISANKAQIVALLQYREILAQFQEIESRPLTDDEKAGIDIAFATLKKQHGAALYAAGWKREMVFDGLDPTRCEKAGDVPTMIRILMAGGRLVAIHPDRLDLEEADGTTFSKIKGNVMIGGSELEKYLKNLQ